MTSTSQTLKNVVPSLENPGENILSGSGQVLKQRLQLKYDARNRT